MLKILYPLLCYYPSQAGGPANTLYWLNSELKPNAFNATIISTQFGLVETIEFKKFSENHRGYFFPSKGGLYLKRSFEELKTADIVQFSSLFFPPTIPILFEAIRKRKTVIISPRGELYDAAISQKAFKKRVWIAVIKMFQNKIHFHATNEFELDIIKRTFRQANSITVIPNYIELPIRQENIVNRNFVFVGRINPIKNLHLLISAIAEVYKIYPDIKLDILGSARLDYEIEYMKVLKVQIENLNLGDVVNFKGHLDGNAKNKIIANSRALILPSKSENFGNVVLEALAQGTPVIASKNTPWQLLEENNAGFWVDGNIQALTSAMLNIINLNETIYKQMRKSAFELCKSQFDIKQNIQIWENYYKKITNYVPK